MNIINRREFMKYMGVGTAAMLGAAVGVDKLVQATENENSKELFNASSRKFTKFQPIDPTDKDDLTLPKGFRYDVVAAWGDDMGNGETFGFNCDLTVYFGIDGASNEGLLWVNHEYIGNGALFVTGYNGAGTRTVEQIEKEKYNLGGSIIHVQRNKDGKWQMVKGSRYNRRITAKTPCVLTGPATGDAAVAGATNVIGTFAGCSGGKTPWNTALSCEENFDGPIKDWAPAGQMNATHYGWVVEVDPFDPTSTPKKRTALGRFSHENTAVTFGKSGRMVVYMGDDANDQYIYKYVSDDIYRPELGKQNGALLEKGTLYVADLSKGVWIPLDLEKTPKLKEKYKTQGEVLVNCRDASKLVGGTPTDRPEDVEVHPKDGSVYIALTNNSKHGNFYGQILRILEDNNDAESTSYMFEVFAVGGPQSGFGCPDNLHFDKEGNLWVVTDISSSSLNKGIYKPFKNNGLFMIPTEGPNKGIAFQFASGPIEAEMTGPWFTPDEKTLFLSVQHPGEETEDPSNPTSRWPHGDIPKPSVVAITGFKGE